MGSCHHRLAVPLINPDAQCFPDHRVGLQDEDDRRTVHDGVVDRLHY